MEPQVDSWSCLEYLNMHKHVQDNLLISQINQNLLPTTLSSSTTPLSISDYIQDNNISPEEIILLDPKSTIPLLPQDFFNHKYLIFGGILGDDPPRDRTSELRKLGYSTRHLGPIQMTTDTAVLVSQLVLENQIPLDEIKFIDHPEIKLGKKETVIMPFRYIWDLDANGNAKMPDGMLKLLQDSNDEPLN